MKSCCRLAIAVASFVLTLGFADGQEIEVPESAEFPVVEMTAAEITFWRSFAGSLRILWAPTTFGRHWPDYGYSWEKARSGTGCNNLNSSQKRAEIGRVALVVATVDGEEYVGFDLTERLSSDPAIVDGQNEAVADLTLQQLCELFTAEKATDQLERDVHGAFYPWSLPGAWTKVDLEEDKKYRQIGSGIVFSPGKRIESATFTWTAADDNMRLAWYAPEATVDASIDSDFVWKFDTVDTDRPTYYLGWDPGQREDVQDVDVFGQFVVDEAGTISLPIEAGTYTLWVETDMPSPFALPITRSEPGNWWLVTERTLPNPELEAEIRTLPNMSDWPER